MLRAKARIGEEMFINGYALIVKQNRFEKFSIPHIIRRCISIVHSKTTILICYLLDYQQVHENTNVSIILLGDKKEPTK